MSQEQLQKMRTDLNLHEIKETLTAIPGEILERQQTLNETRTLIEDAEINLKEHEAEIMFEISQETNGDKDKPKPKFSNDTARKTELTRRLAEDEDYQNTKSRFTEVQTKRHGLDIEIDRLRNDFRVQMALKDLAVAEMQLLGS